MGIVLVLNRDFQVIESLAIYVVELFAISFS